MARRRRWIGVAGAGVVAALLLARGCGDGPRPPESPPRDAPAVAAPAAPPRDAPPPAAPVAPASAPVAAAPEPATTGAIVGVALRLDGVPAAGARVRAAPGGAEEQRVVATAGPDGAFRFEGLAPGRWTVACGGGGYGTRLDEKAPAAVADVVAGKEVRVEVRGQELSTIAGRVTGPDGKPIPKAVVTVHCRAFLSPDGGVWRIPGETGPDGTYEVRNVTPGEDASVRIAAEGFGPGHRWLPDVDTAERTVVDMTLLPAASLEIRLVAADDGTPVREAYVWLRDAEGDVPYEGVQGGSFAPDAEGRVRASGLNPRAVRVQVDARGFVRVEDTTVDPATQSGPFVLRLARAWSISGRLLRADGTPAAGLEVYATPEGDRSPLAIFHSGDRDSTDDDGAFVLEGLPAGRYVVSHRGRGMESLVEATVEAGARDVVLRLASAGGPRVIRVRFADAAGNPVPRARCLGGHLQGGEIISRSGNTYPVEGLTVSLEEGLTSFVEAWNARDAAGNHLPLGHVFALVPSDAPDPWVVVLPPERTVEGTVVGPGGKPVEGARVEVVTVPGEGIAPSMGLSLGETRSVAGGAYRVVGLGTGRVQLRATADGVLGRPREVVPGATGLVLELSPEVRCELRMLDHAGKPVEGAIVSAVIPEDDGNSPWPERSVTSDSRGSVRLRGLEPDRAYLLLVFPPSSRPDVLALRRPGWKPEGGDVRLPKACRIEGSVRWGAAGAKGVVRAFREGECIGVADVDEDGRFTIGSLPPGRYEVTAVTAGREPERRASASAEADGPPVTLRVEGE